MFKKTIDSIPIDTNEKRALPRSTGIALNVMKAGGVLNQPSGQLLLAAATVNAAKLHWKEV